MRQYRKERIDRPIKARCDDIFALSSPREVAYLLLPRAVPVIALLSFPLLKGIVGMYWENVLVLTTVIALLALSWEFMGLVGLTSLGQALFFGAGGYCAAALSKYAKLPVFLTIPLGTVGGALLCTLLLIPVLRLRGVYFSILTLALPLFFMRIIEATKILGGNEGLSGLDGIDNLWVSLYLPLGLFLLCLFGFRRLMGTDYGVVLQAVRDNDRSVMAAAININRLKAEAVFVAALAGSFAGAFMTHYYRFVGISAFALDYSILPLAAAVLGGTGSFAGAAVGAFILVPLSEILRAFGTLRVVFYSAILVICIIGLPEGIFHYLQRKYHQTERWVEV